MWEELRDYTPEQLRRHDRDYARWVRQGLAAGRLLAIVVEGRDGRVAGSGGLWLMPSEPRPGPLGRGEVPYILSMYTEPDARGRGVASRIVREMVRWARERGYGRIVLHASKFGRPVYERLGFETGSEMRKELLRHAAGRPRRPRRPAPRRRT
jgi:GNAT superfamily N-acetyltransferase